MRFSAQSTIRVPRRILRMRVLFAATVLLILLGVILMRSGIFPTPQKASAQQISCANRPSAFMFLIDRSGSMGSPISKLADARNATTSFINRLKTYTTVPNTYAGAISVAYSQESTDPLPVTKLEWRLTGAYQNVIDAVNKITTVGGSTCISCSIKLANEQFSLYSSDGRRKNIAIVITDGGARESLDGHFDTSDAWDEAISYADDSVGRYDTTFYVINIDPNTPSYDLRRMQDLVDANPNKQGKYFFKDSSQIDNALDEIFKLYNSTTISGHKYNDINRDGKYQSSIDGKLPNWKIYLKDQAGKVIDTTTTDSGGSYQFDQVCNGTYSLSEEQQLPDWDEINPNQLINSIPVTVSNYTEVENQDFFNAKALEYTISGAVYVDTNGNNKMDGSEVSYAGGQSKLTWQMQGNPSVPISTPDGNYTIAKLHAGQYVVSYDYASSSHPPGYTPFLRPPALRVTIGPNCTFQSSLVNARCVSGNIQNLNFALRNSNPWFQDETLDMRFDFGMDDNLPSSNIVASETKARGTPGVIFTGNKTANFGSGHASSRDWVVGGSIPEKYKGNGALQTSYLRLLSTITKSGTTINPHPISTVCGAGGASNCDLNPSFDGPYTITGNLIITKGSVGTIPNPRKIVLLVEGNVIIRTNIKVAKGSYLLISATGNTNVESCTTCSTGQELEGLFVSNDQFVAESSSSCPDRPDEVLKIGGTVVVNASRANLNESFIRLRNLCDSNQTSAAIRFNERADFILSTPDYINSRAIIWKEVAP